MVTATIGAVGWLRAAGVRALKTAAEVAASMIVTGSVIWELNWTKIVGITATATVLSLLWSLRGLPETSTSGVDSTNSMNNIGNPGGGAR